MTAKHQKSQEKLYVECAAELLGQTWSIDEDWWNNCKESPDFLIRNADGDFGLEVTKIFKGNIKKSGSAHKGRESVRGRKLLEFQKKYEEKTQTKIHLKIYIQEYLWGEDGTIDDTYFEKILKILFELDLPSKEFGFSQHKKLDDGTFFGFTKGDRLPWQLINDTAGWVNTSPDKKISEAINVKSKKLSKYRKNADQNDIRLLVVADRLLNSGKLTLRDNISVDFKDFTKVYFLSFPESIFELAPLTAP